MMNILYVHMMNIQYIDLACAVYSYNESSVPQGIPRLYNVILLDRRLFVTTNFQ